MTLTPQIVYVCTHTIETCEKKMAVLCVTRNEFSDSDSIAMGATIQQVYSIYSIVDENNMDYHFYYKDIDYRIVAPRFVQWIGENKPEVGTVYYVDCYYIKLNIEEYNEDDCPRCLGNGWYVDLMPQSETNINKLSKSNKIVQDFIKIIFTYQTEDNGYGTKIVDYIGKEIFDVNQVCSEIVSMIYNAATYYKNLQMTSILSGNQLSDNELLDRIMIESIAYDETTGQIYIEISLYSKSGVQNTIGIGI